jgi:hypothetical protein
MRNTDEVESPALSFIPMLSVNDPARAGGPEMVPLGERMKLVGSWPLGRADVVIDLCRCGLLTLMETAALVVIRPPAFAGPLR